MIVDGVDKNRDERTTVSVLSSVRVNSPIAMLSLSMDKRLTGV